MCGGLVNTALTFRAVWEKAHVMRFTGGLMTAALLGTVLVAPPPSAQAEPREVCQPDRAASVQSTTQLDLADDHPAAARLLPAVDARNGSDFQHDSLGQLTVSSAEFGVVHRQHGPGHQIVGVAATPSDLDGHTFNVAALCSDTPTIYKKHHDGSLEVTSVDGVNLGAIAAPWAYDADGRSLDTHYQIVPDGFVQHIDTTDAVFPVTFDPTYTSISCAVYGRWANKPAWQYLDMVGLTDYGYCPASILHERRNGYSPVWAWEGNVGNDYGWVLVRQAGECGFISDTGPTWDFQVPCKAHDYCYDLRKGGLSGTVSDSQCDLLFDLLMRANCDDRNIVARAACEVQAAIMTAAVGPAVTNPDPAWVSLQPNHWGNRCADVFNGSTSNYADIVQWTCHTGTNQHFKFWPASGYPGQFQIINQKSGKCLYRDPATGKIEQYTCANYASQRWHLQGWNNQDTYTIRLAHVQTICWEIPGASTTLGIQISTNTCTEPTHQRWNGLPT